MTPVEAAAKAAHDVHWSDEYPYHEHDKRFWEETTTAAILAFLAAADAEARQIGDADAVREIGKLREIVS